MPYSKIIPLTANHLRSVLPYLRDNDHPHHVEYSLTPIELSGSKTEAGFIIDSINGCEANRKKRKGRKAKNIANWHIIRLPDGTWSSDREKEAIAKAVQLEAGEGLGNWHDNKLTGSSDYNWVTRAFTATGLLIRDRGRDVIRSLRRRMDEITDHLNLEREKLGVEPIQTMREVTTQKRKELKRMLLAQQLAQLPEPPMKIGQLKAALLDIKGLSISRFNPEKDYLSIAWDDPQTTKTHPKKKGKKAIKFSIVDLMGDVDKELKSKGLDQPCKEIPIHKAPFALLKAFPNQLQVYGRSNEEILNDIKETKKKEEEINLPGL